MPSPKFQRKFAYVGVGGPEGPKPSVVSSPTVDSMPSKPTISFALTGLGAVKRADQPDAADAGAVAEAEDVVDVEVA